MILILFAAWLACGLLASIVLMIACMISDGTSDVFRQIQKYWAESALIAFSFLILGPLSLIVVIYSLIQVRNDS
jgi:hypothetical protein